jgi:cyclophilin family peptidyl-prolyl cis-trans isomerase
MRNTSISVVVVIVVFIIGYFLWGMQTPAPVDLGIDLATTTAVTQQTSLPDATNAIIATTTAPAQSVTNQNNTKAHMITIDTNYGTITIETYDSDAPNTVANFVKLASKGFYNGLTFHRVIPGFMVQGGDPTGTGRGGPGYQFADELNPATASYKAGYKTGVVAMANAGPNTNGSQFFIMDADYPLPNNYTIFGHVVSGQDVVDAIAHVKRDGSDKPLTAVTMKMVTVK